jgi:asparagine synthase (glutamine-hydrolysing)
VFGWYEGIPAPLRRALVEPLMASGLAGRLPLVRKAASYVRQARVPLPDRTQMYNLLLRLGTAEVLEPAFRARLDEAAPLARERATWAGIDARSDIDRMLGYDWKYTLADNDLPKVVGTTDLASVAVGFPFLDQDLLDFSLTLPPHWKVRGVTLRWFFKEALRGFLPDAIIAKKKHGFGLPFGVWAVQDRGLDRFASDALRSFATRGVIRKSFIDTLLGRWLPEHPGYYGEMVWIVMVLETWLRAHAPDYSASAGS